MSKLKEVALRADFGIEDLLKDGSKTVYENLFSTRHIGRVFDFFYFESEKFFKLSQESALLEYRFRQLLELFVFNAWTNGRSSEKAKCVELEVGYDDNKMVLSVYFSVDQTLSGFMPGSTDAPSNAAAERMKKMLEQSQIICDGMMVRLSKRSSRIQVVGFIELNPAGNKTDVEYLEVSDITIKSAGSAKAPQEAPVPLSGANVNAFTQDEKSSMEHAHAQQGHVTSNDTVKVSGGYVENDPAASFVMPPHEDTNDDWLLKASQESDSGSDVVTVSGGQFQEQDEGVVKVTGGPEDVSSDLIKIKSQGIGDLQDDGMTVIKSVTQVLDTNTLQDIEDAAKILADEIRTEIIDVVPMLAQSNYSDLFNETTATIREHYTKAIENLKKLVAAQGVEPLAENKVVAELDPVKESEQFDGMVGSYEQALEQSGMSAQFKAKAKEFLDSVQKERAEFNKKVKEHEDELRKIAHRANVQETALGEQIRIKDDQLRQKDLAIEKTKESLTTAIAAIEKFKTAMKTGDVADLTSKLMTTEKMLQVSRDNSQRDQKRIEDLQARWNSESATKNALNKELMIKQRLFNDLQRKFDALASGQTAGNTLEAKNEQMTQKMIDTLKGQIRELQAKLASANAIAAKAQTQSLADARSKGGGGMSAATEAQWKLKVDQAMKINKTFKEENEKHKKKIDDMRLAETKLKVEIGKLQAQIKIMNAKK